MARCQAISTWAQVSRRSALSRTEHGQYKPGGLRMPIMVQEHALSAAQPCQALYPGGCSLAGASNELGVSASPMATPNSKLQTSYWPASDPASLQGFFYNRYPAPEARGGELGTETDINENQELWYHVVGTPQSEDPFVAHIPEHPQWQLGADVTDDGRHAHARVCRVAWFRRYAIMGSVSAVCQQPLPLGV